MNGPPGRERPRGLGGGGRDRDGSISDRSISKPHPHGNNGGGMPHVWEFYVNGAEITICVSRDAILDLGLHVHIPMNAPLALMIGSGLLHLIEHDKENDGQLWRAIEEEVSDAHLPS